VARAHISQPLRPLVVIVAGIGLGVIAGAIRLR
jgi:hypothetical protein